MIKRFVSTICAISLAATLGYAEAKHGIVVYTHDGDIEQQYNEVIEKKITTLGYKVADPHKRINDVYKKKYGSTKLDLLTFMTVVNDTKLKPLLNIDPRLAGFNPFDVFAYKKTGENTTQVSHLTADAILDMLHIEDASVRAEYTATMKSLDDLIVAELKGKTSYIDYDKVIDKTTMNFEIDFQRPEDLSEFIDDFQSRFEEAFEAKQYIIAGFFNFYEHFGDGPNPLEAKFDAFWTYSLCHFTFSYNIFDNEGMKPEAGVFAPCTMYMYIEKGSNKLVVGMPRLANWAAMVNITDKKRLDFIKQLDTEIPQIMVGLGAKEVESTPFPMANGSTTATTTETKEVKKEEKAAENANVVVEARKVAKPSNVGFQVGDKISSFLVGPYAAPEQVIADLEANGFEVLATHKVGDLSSIVFTSAELKKMASRKDRGFAAAMRVLVDQKANKISITNPLYFGKAYMQADFRAVATRTVLENLNKSFEGLKNSEDVLEEDDLADYQFMMGMPKYNDMDVVAEGTDAELLAKVKKSGKVLFELKLGDATLVGVEISKRTAKFPAKIGEGNAMVLPYTVLIEDGKAKSLAPKYNIALYYPMLTMSAFMTIATIPGAIVGDLENAFK
jgi:uncharacterized protein (DUF302 family)